MKPALILPGLLERVRQSRPANGNLHRQREEISELFPAGLPAPTSAVIEAVRKDLAALGCPVEGDNGGRLAVQAAMLLTHDWGLTEDEAWPPLLDWSRTGTPTWKGQEKDLREKLRNGERYGKNPIGFKRVALEPLPLAYALIDKWQADGAERDSMPGMIEKVRKLVRFCGSLANRTQIEIALRRATGLPAKALDLPRDVDPVARAEREAREGAFHAGKVSVLDREDHPDIAARYLRSTHNEEAHPSLVRNQYRWLRRCDAENLYRETEDEDVHRDLGAFLEGATDKDTGRPVKNDQTLVERVTFQLRRVAHVTDTALPFWRDGGSGRPSPSDLILFRNGSLDIETGIFDPPTRALISTYAAPYDFDPNAPSPERWNAFLNEVFDGDREQIELLREFMGYLSTDDTSQQKILAMIGALRGGKGTIARTMTDLVGAPNACSPTLASLGGQFGMAPLLDKRLAISADERNSSRGDLQARVSNLLRIAGEDMVTVDRKHRAAVSVKLNCRFVLISNEPPVLPDNSGALASRFLMLHFKNSFLGKEDPHLQEKLRAEMPGIVLWALEGLRNLRKRGRFVQPEKGRELLEDLARLGSPVKAFVEDRCELAPEGVVLTDKDRVPCGLLFQAWQQWCHEQGREHPGSLAIFAKDLKVAFPRINTKQARVSGGVVRFFVGLKLRDSMVIVQ